MSSYKNILKIVVAVTLWHTPFTTQAESDNIAGVSKISAVTIYQDRALVTRKATVQIPAGDATITFEKFPNSVNPDSLRISATGNSPITLKNVELKTKFDSQNSESPISIIKEKILKLEFDLEALNSERQRFNKEKEMLAKLDLNTPLGDGSNGARARTTKEIKELLGFLSESIKGIDVSLLQNSVQRSRLEREISDLRKELDRLLPVEESQSVVQVDLTATNSGTAEFSISYQVNGARWIPSYNLETSDSSDSNVVTFDSYAVLMQTSGEAWENVEVTLSTARPHLGITRPEPEPLVLDIFQPMQMMPRKMAAAAVGGSQAMDLVGEEAAFSRDKANEATAVEQTADMSRYGSIIYTVPSKMSVPSDGSESKVKVASMKLSSTFTNIAVPYLSTDVYEEAEVENGQAPLLPGSVSVYRDGSFVGTHQVDYIPAGKKFKISVGVSQDLSVKRTLIKKFEDDSGIVRSFRKIFVQYEIEIENLDTKDAKVVVMDRKIESRNTKIAVTMEPQKWEWELNLKPKEKRVIPYSATVEFPSDLSVSSLEEL